MNIEYNRGLFMLGKRIYEILEAGNDNDKVSRFYDVFMIAAIVISIAPLMTN